MSAGILSGNAIARAVYNGEIHIQPFTEAQINPASYDVTLGRGVRMYRTLPDQCFEPMVRLDAKKDNQTRLLEMFEDGMLLKPGIGYLMHTEERIRTDCYVPVIDGKSSVGRLFVQIHFTAGYGDPGFDGQYTLEVSVLYPTRLYPGMRIGQVRFHTLVGQPDLYRGSYQGASASGPNASRSWTQFKDSK